MKVSHNWLQKYFTEKIPEANTLADLFTFRAFEVEGIERLEHDTIIDVKVLPDRAHYALSHWGVAEEIAVNTDLKIIEPAHIDLKQENISLSITVDDAVTCPRYIGRGIENVTITDSPTWLKERLEAIGSRSINSVVDATNYVMLDLGQPLHAFDKDKVKGGIVVRKAKEGEVITTLDGKEVKLDHSILVIADNEGPLAIAGVKGGKRAEVTKETKNIILESANFDAVAVRKTSTKVGIRNESSKRYENAITPELARIAMNAVTALIVENSPQARIGQVTDVYSAKLQQTTIAIDPVFIASRLGVHISEEEMINILQKMNIDVQKVDTQLVLTIPHRRLDLVIPEDIVEEVGRAYGYDKIESKLPHIEFTPQINKDFYYSEKIKNILTDLGFTETSLYTLVSNGDFEVAYPLAADKNMLRTNLAGSIAKSLEFNAKNADVLGLDAIKIFEIGKVFSKTGEHLSLSIGVQMIKKVKGMKSEDVVKKALEILALELGTTLDGKIVPTQTNTTVEIHLDELIAKLLEPQSWDIAYEPLKNTQYKKFSVYPFIVRDIALFVPEGIKPEEVQNVLDTEARELRVLTRLFDVFTKDGKTSYAFRLVFQSSERTLTIDEVETIMQNIYTAVATKNWLVR